MRKKRIRLYVPQEFNELIEKKRNDYKKMYNLQLSKIKAVEIFLEEMKRKKFFSMKNKKGDIFDIMVFVFFLFILGIGLYILSAYFFSPLSSSLKNIDVLNQTTENQAILEKLENMGNIIDVNFLIILLGLYFFVIVSAFFVDVSPIWFFIYFILNIFSIFLSFYFSNTFFYAYDESLFKSNYIYNVMKYLPYFSIGAMIISLFIIFTKKRMSPNYI